MWVGSEAAGWIGSTAARQHFHFDKQSGLLSDLIRTLYLDEQGVVWIGTARSRIEPLANRAEHWPRSPPTKGCRTIPFRKFSKTSERRLWLGNGRGIVCASARMNWRSLAAGKIPAVYPALVYGRADGMPSEECTGGFSPAGLKSEIRPALVFNLEGHCGGGSALARRGHRSANRAA